VTDLLDRLNRWSTGLPMSEPIPITDAEALQLAVYAESQSIFHGESVLDADRQADIMETILAGRFQFAGHRVQVL
jgi:hypothetical protein